MSAYYVHNLDPVAFAIGPVVIRWYALSYIAGLVLGWQYAVRLCRSFPQRPTRLELDDFLVWAVFGVILGGRLGHILFYYPEYYFQHPLEIFEVWKGGMAFHGGIIGVLVAMALFAKKRGIPLLLLGDVVSAAAPIGLFFGRIANFINGELWGRVTDVPWAVIFPRAGPEPRHPSQLYEAGLEGAVLFLILFVAIRFFDARRRPGMVSGLFLIGYGLARSVSESLREPEVLQAVLPFGTTWGQWLSLPMVLIGLAMVVWVFRRPKLKPDDA